MLANQSGNGTGRISWKGEIMEWPLKPNVGDVIRGEARTPLGQPLFKNIPDEQLIELGYITAARSLSGMGAGNEMYRRSITPPEQPTPFQSAHRPIA